MTGKIRTFDAMDITWKNKDGDMCLSVLTQCIVCNKPIVIDEGGYKYCEEHITEKDKQNKQAV